MALIPLIKIIQQLTASLIYVMQLNTKNFGEKPIDDK